MALRIHNTEEGRDEWQHLRPGDVVRMIPKGWLHLASEGSGNHSSRLVSHTREHRQTGPAATLSSTAAVPMELVTSIMTRGMLLGIRRRAERSAG